MIRNHWDIGCGCIKKSVLLTKDGSWSALPPFFAFFSQKRPQQVQKYLYALTGVSRRSLCLKRQSVRSSKAIFYGIPASAFSSYGLSVALCAVYSPFHSCCPDTLHCTIFWAFLSTDIRAKGKRIWDFPKPWKFPAVFYAGHESAKRIISDVPGSGIPIPEEQNVRLCGSVPHQTKFLRRRILESSSAPNPNEWRSGCRWEHHHSSCRE